MLLDRSLLVQDGSIYRPTGTIESLAVPETLQALIAARLDGLPPEERRLIQDAAVLGKTFTKRTLAALGGVPEAGLEPLLSSLTRKEVLGVQSDPRSPEHGQYGFLQDLLRKVAYETLARTDRKARHLAAAAQLEQGWSDQEAAVGGRRIPLPRRLPGRPRRRRRAGDPSEGRRNGSRGPANVQRHSVRTRKPNGTSRRRRNCKDDVVTKAGLHEQAGRMAWRGARPAEARDLLETAGTVFEEKGLTRRAARVSSALAELDYRDGHPPYAAVARPDDILDALEGVTADEVVAEVAAHAGRFLVLNRHRRACCAPPRVGPGAGRGTRLPEVFAQGVLTSKSIFYTYRNRLEEGRILLEGALERALAGEFHAAALRAFNNLAVTLESSDRYAEAVDLSDRALELSHAESATDSGKDCSSAAARSAARSCRALGRCARTPRGIRVVRRQRHRLHAQLAGHGDLPCAGDLCCGACVASDKHLVVGSGQEDIQSHAGYLLAEAQLLRAEGRPREALGAAPSAGLEVLEALGHHLPHRQDERRRGARGSVHARRRQGAGTACARRRAKAGRAAAWRRSAPASAASLQRQGEFDTATARFRSCRSASGSPSHCSSTENSSARTAAAKTARHSSPKHDRSSRNSARNHGSTASPYTRRRVPGSRTAPPSHNDSGPVGKRPGHRRLS